MKIKQVLFLLSIFLLSTSFTHKDLNEYGKWLAFYGITDEDFRQTGAEKNFKADWKEFDLSTEDKKLYDNLFFYTEDSSSFLDLYSYSVMIDKDAQGNLTWEGGDPDSKIQLVKTKGLTATTLLFLGTDEFAETAVWRNKHIVEALGFTIENDNYIPTTWRFDLDKQTYVILKNKKTFKSRPKSYLIEVRLKGIRMKE